MSRPTVYLAGAITGSSFDGATSWRQIAIERLADSGIVGVSPLRGKAYLSHLDQITDDNAAQINSLMSGQRGIMARDHFDCKRADAVLVNLLGAERVSIGTVMEIAWAWDARIPVVAIRERGCMHEHAMLNEATDFRVDSLDEALNLIVTLLEPYAHGS